MNESKVSDQINSSPNSPELSSSGKATRKAITSSDQAYAMATHLEKGNEERNKIDAIVLKKYNGGLPYEKTALAASLESWRSNASFGAMSGIVDRITPTPIQAIDAARYLTSASLTPESPESDKKSEFFCRKVTTAIRSWDGWKDFITSLAQENVLMGRAAPLNLHPYSPWPKMFHGNEVFFDDGIGQHAKLIPCLVCKEDLLIHEFVHFIKDGKEIAEHAGWNFDECIKVVNDALPKSPTQTSADTTDFRLAEDAIREGNIGASHSGAKVVQLYHVLAVEPDTKKVTYFIVNRRDNHEQLFKKEDRFEKMEDVVTLFCLQPGNGKYYSSRGIGRMILNAIISQERARNSMLDNLNMAGMKVLVVPPNSTPSLQTKVMNPFMVVSSDGVFEEHGITSNVKDFVEADNQVSRWMEQLVGSYISGLRGDDGGPTRTAHEAVIDAQRDAQAKTAFVARFLGQLANQIGQITRRLCDPETTDDIAKKLQKELKDPELGNLSDDEIKELANAPSAEVVQDMTAVQDQKVLAAYELFKGDPDFNQREFKMRVASAAVSAQFAKDVMLDEQGVQANEAEAARQQMIETEAILAGAAGMPVSPRDLHPIHLKVAFADLKGALPKIPRAAQNDPAALDHMNAQLVHTRAHIETWKSQGAMPADIKPFEDAQKHFELVLHQIGQSLMQQAQEGGMQQAGAPPASPMAQEAPDTPNADKEPTAPSGGMSEKVLTSWISQYPNLPEPERAKLEQISGLGVAPAPIPGAGVRGETIHPIDSRMAPRSARQQAPPIVSSPPPAPPEKLPPLPK